MGGPLRRRDDGAHDEPGADDVDDLDRGADRQRLVDVLGDAPVVTEDPDGPGNAPKILTVWRSSGMSSKPRQSVAPQYSSPVTSLDRSDWSVTALAFSIRANLSRKER